MNTFLAQLQSLQCVPAPLLEAAQRRQAKFAGSLGTNLLELNAIHPRTLDDLLSRYKELPAVTLVGLMASERPVGNVPSALLKDPMLAPLAVSRGELWMVVHPDIPAAFLQELREQYPDLRFAITAECCFSLIWSQAYGSETSARFTALADDYIEQLQSFPPGEMRPAPLAKTTDANSPISRSAGRSSHVPAALAVDPPDDWEAIQTALRRAEDRDVVTYLLQRAAQQLSERVALFRIRDDELIGLPGPPCALDVTDIRLPLTPSLSHALMHPRSIRRCLDLDLRLSVGLEQAMPCICAPVGLRGRPVLLLYLDRNGESFNAEEINAVHALCSVSASQLLMHLRRNNRPAQAQSEPARDLPSSTLAASFHKDTQKGDTHPELPILSRAEQQPSFLSSSQGDPSFDEWSSDQKAVWENALETEDIEYFEQQGAKAIEELANRLPGPQDSGEPFNSEALRSASSSGRVPRLLVTLGDPCVDPVLRALHQGDPSVRFVAALIFQELRSDRCLDALAALCFDPASNVRRIAARVLETYRESPGFPDACHQVRDCLTHPDPNQQRYAIAALGILRDTESVPELIERLDDARPEHKNAALASLCSISGQQCGQQKDAWNSWYKKHRHEPREQWLASSLSHKDVRVRAWAHDELVRVTGFDSHFDAQAPRSQRNAAIERWRSWWSSTRLSELGSEFGNDFGNEFGGDRSEGSGLHSPRAQPAQ